jgi:AcrR family transcriptional regulator
VTAQGRISVAERVLPVVTAMLEAGGPDAVLVREVARQARVSLREIYNQFGSRDELIEASVEQWMDAHVYVPLAEPTPDPTLYDTLVEHFRRIFEPWEESPHMLEAFVYARSTAGGSRLLEQGYKAAEPVITELFHDVDPAFAEDVQIIITNVVYAQMSQVAAGEISGEQIMPTVERVLRRLTYGVPRSTPLKGGTAEPRSRP